jgi:hypothetical protein
MNNEFKKSKSNNETRYTLESMTAGATGSGSVATAPSSLGKVQKRGNILAQEAGKDKVPATTPRNFVAKNAKSSGAGAHKDKKKEQKQGAEKHKKPYMESLRTKIDQLKSRLAEQGVAEGKVGADPYDRGYHDGQRMGSNSYHNPYSRSDEPTEWDEYKSGFNMAQIELQNDLEDNGFSEGKVGGFPKKVSKKEVDKFQKKNNDKLTGREVNRQEQEKKPANKQQGVAEGDRPFRGVGGAFNRGDDERHDLDPTDWYVVKDGKMFKTSVYPNQVQLAIAQGYSRTRDEAKAKAGKQGVAEAGKDVKDIWAADTQMLNILLNPDRKQLTDYTPEEISQLQKLAKILGRARKIIGGKFTGMSIGQVLDKLEDNSRLKQRDGGKMPDFTGRATTTADMGKQIALHTNGNYYTSQGKTWTSGRTGQRIRDANDYIKYNDKKSLDDAWAWVQSKGKQVNYRDNFNQLQTAVQIGSFIVEPNTVTRDVSGSNPDTEHGLSVRSVKSLSQWSRKREEQGVAEGASDFIGDAIEALRSSVPGLQQQDFLDELYMYIENQYGQRAAEMMSNAGQDDYDDWYDNYLDNPEQSLPEVDVYMESLAHSLQRVLSEKAVSKKQQRFMGMVHAAQKGEKPASKEVAKTAKGMGKKDAEDFASTKHKGLPEKKKSKK